MKIKRATTQKELNELDKLLWEVLWKPLNLERNIRESFKFDKPQVDIIAIENNVVIGALVANWLSNDEIEIRHIAVKKDFQRSAIGTMLVDELFEIIKTKTPVTIQTHARNTSVGFFSKLGFHTVGARLHLDPFIQHGIWLQQMSAKR